MTIPKPMAMTMETARMTGTRKGTKKAMATRTTKAMMMATPKSRTTVTTMARERTTGWN